MLAAEDFRAAEGKGRVMTGVMMSLGFCEEGKKVRGTVCMAGVGLWLCLKVCFLESAFQYGVSENVRGKK